MTIWVCKTCGRAMRCEKKPAFCYADRTTSIENISDEDSVKMQLFSTLKHQQIDFENEEIPIILEFPGDLKFSPISGNTVSGIFHNKYTLTEYQNEIMKRVKGIK